MFQIFNFSNKFLDTRYQQLCHLEDVLMARNDGVPHATFDQNISWTKLDMKKSVQGKNIPFSKIFSIKQTEEKRFLLHIPFNIDETPWLLILACTSP